MHSSKSSAKRIRPLTDGRIIGRNAVTEALKTGADISKIYVHYSARGNGINDIFSLAKRSGVPISRVDSKQFAELTAGMHADESAQGVVATISKVKFEELETILEAASGKQYPLILILDHIMDPQNFGAILRSAAFFHVDGIIVSKQDQAPVSETVAKASAGGLFHVRIAREANLHQVARLLKERGYWIATSAADAPLMITEVDFRMPIAVIIGNEGSGVRKILREKSDITFSIPRSGRIDSLNVSVATGIICYEIQRQRSEMTGDPGPSSLTQIDGQLPHMKFSGTQQ